MPLSKRPAARQRQLANLKQAPPAPAENQRARRHGGYAAVAHDRLDSKVLELHDALADDAPLRDQDGGLPRHDTAAVSLLARCLCRLEDVERYLSEFGWRDEDTGEPRSAVELERRLRQEAADHLDSLGMSPRSRSKLGLNLVQTIDLARAMSELDDDA